VGTDTDPSPLAVRLASPTAAEVGLGRERVVDIREALVTRCVVGASVDPGKQGQVVLVVKIIEVTDTSCELRVEISRCVNVIRIVRWPEHIEARDQSQLMSIRCHVCALLNRISSQHSIHIATLPKDVSPYLTGRCQ
jgi:hypothetical protein